MKVLVCGLGSMGKRRIRILQNRVENLEIFGVDINEQRRTALENRGVKTFEDFIAAFKTIKPDAVFACSPPLTHSDIVIFSLSHGAHTFSEINLNSNQYGDIIQAASMNNLQAFLSSTFLYNREIQWIMDKIAGQKRLIYRYHTGQFLPDWHPWESVEDFFVSKKETSAIREIMAIEFPWIVKTFGEIVDYQCMTATISQLSLDYPDSIFLNLKHGNGSFGSIVFDCVCTCASRKLEIYNDDCFLSWDGRPGTLNQYLPDKKQFESVKLYNDIQKDESYAQFIIENPYIEEVAAFFKKIETKEMSNVWGYEQDKTIIDLIDAIENEYE